MNFIFERSYVITFNSSGRTQVHAGAWRVHWSARGKKTMCASLWRAHPAGLFSHGLVLPRACSPTGLFSHGLVLPRALRQRRPLCVPGRVSFLRTRAVEETLQYRTQLSLAMGCWLPQGLLLTSSIFYIQRDRKWFIFCDIKFDRTECSYRRYIWSHTQLITPSDPNGKCVGSGWGLGIGEGGGSR